ncbi:cytochrome ubiquinol oxidase subunit I [Halodesulfovibrio sp. MK-HDV]|jgi:cytochrome bd ubiquinol oxidase subunit I|uniref:cytochrome ubiquinol oxidase subunit I n=1 Tax=unclassified Halodesulfovibrio TaxID=2644657 RepID=UPI00136DA7FA|nr:cytochrome ubiquinol oxidase subunit I [Halodesulfovibrio sp. MK-HDV]KAF1074437.1 Cytochrome bd-II ubiquinol oxidase subunit 1 [Halodesulfovibrio sp. MK-HDV]
MDVVMLSRIQFAVTIFFHFIFVPLTLGLSILLAIMETMYVRTGNEMYKRMVKFWGKLFIINFTLGVVTGITLEFQFGTNWSRYSEYVGDIFGSLLAIEASTSFFLESTFIAVWFFGWKKVSKKVHLMCIWIVALAANMSAFWIIMANAFMQNPIGYKLVNGKPQLDDFIAVITNQYGIGIYAHTLTSSWMVGGLFVMGISAWHLARKNEVELFKSSFKMASVFFFIFSLGTAAAGHHQGQIAAEYQPAKLAAMESHWETGTNVPMYLLTWPNSTNTGNVVQALPIPDALSILAYNNPDAEVIGLNDIPKEDRPPVLPVFISFRLMVALGSFFPILGFALFFWRKKIEEKTFVLKVLPWLIPLPYIGIMLGWAVTEMGRQPWIVYSMLRTSDAASPIEASMVVWSIIAFTIIYSFLGVLDIYLLRKYAIKGPK